MYQKDTQTDKEVNRKNNKAKKSEGNAKGKARTGKHMDRRSGMEGSKAARIQDGKRTEGKQPSVKYAGEKKQTEKLAGGTIQAGRQTGKASAARVTEGKAQAGRGAGNRTPVGKGADGKAQAGRGAGNRVPVGKGADGKAQAGRGKGKPLSAGTTARKAKELCPAAGKCGACKWLRISYEEQLKQKEKEIKELCGEFGKFEPIIGMEEPYHYRNKVHAVFGEDRKHNIISGIYEEKTHRIVPVDECLLEDKRADAIIVSIRTLLKSFKIRPYNEDTGYGLFRHVLIRTGLQTGQILVVLILTSPIMPSKNNFVKALLKLHPEITTVVLNVNDRGTSMVMGKKEYVLYGKGYIEDILCEKKFRISPQSFYQVNPFQTEKLYTKAMQYAGLTGREVVLDAYCGTGTIGLIASEKAREVIGVELNGAAVRDAVTNAKINNVDNIIFYEKDAGEFMVQMAEQEARVDVVFMDPPRAGSDEAFLSSLVRLKPERVVYISCNPETLARDLKYLAKRGYKMVKGVGVDMFPWTGHVESVVLMSRVEK